MKIKRFFIQKFPWTSRYPFLVKRRPRFWWNVYSEMVNGNISLEAQYTTRKAAREGMKELKIIYDMKELFV